jgi:hypothetical protein
MILGYIIRIVVSVIVGLITGMSVWGIVLLSVVLIVATEVISQIILKVFDIDEEGILIFLSVVFQIIFLVVILINYNSDERYIPEAGIAASLDGKEAISLKTIDAGEDFYLQIRVAIKSNSIARRFFGNNDIPFTIEVSPPEASAFSEAQNVQFCKETKPAEADADKRVYYYTVHAAGNPKPAIIDFKVTPEEAGSQVIKITYDKKVSDIHTKTVTLEYKD